MSEDLSPYRKQIDAIDQQILQLLNERAALARAIGSLKKSQQIYHAEREAQILRALSACNQGPLDNAAITNVFRAIISNCRALERELTVAFLGPAGTYTEEAALKQFGSAIKAMPCASIDAVFDAIESHRADYGVAPVENSSEGSIGRTLDLLFERSLQVCGEVALPVHHCLLSSVDSITQVERVYAHAQALAQCRGWLHQHLVNIPVQEVSSNAEAARLVTEKPRTAAIAGARAGELFQLRCLAENIEDSAHNTTRFLVLAQHDALPSGNDKTSLVMAARNIPGAVVSLLQPFARHGVSMSRLESRPFRAAMWEYVFFVDIEGHKTDIAVASALSEIQPMAACFKVIGSYPSAVM